MKREILGVVVATLLSVEQPRPLPIDPERPSEPPDPVRYVPPSEVREPQVPPKMARIKADALAEAIAKNAERPGETAFRTAISAFMHHNRALAEAQAEREGLSIEEIEELTYFGMMVQESQRWLPADQRERGSTLMHELNREFKLRMRQMVAEGADEEERWRYIRDTEDRYLTAYFALSGMNEQQLDERLAAAGTPPIDDAPVNEEPEEEVERPPSPPDP